MICEGHAAFDEAGTFGFEQAALQARERLADGDPASRSHNAVPGNGLAARASCHGSSGGASASGQPRSPSQLAIRDNAPLRDTFDQRVNLAPAGIHASKDNRNVREFPVLPLYETK